MCVIKTGSLRAVGSTHLARPQQQTVKRHEAPEQQEALSSSTTACMNACDSMLEHNSMHACMRHLAAAETDDEGSTRHRDSSAPCMRVSAAAAAAVVRGV